MSKPPLIRQIAVPIYDVWLCLVVADSRDVFVRHAKKHYGVDYPEDSFGQGATMFNAEGKFCVYLLRQSLTHKHIAHELFHVTVRILDYIGVKFDPANHEAHSYLNDWLHARVYRLLANHRETVRVKSA